MMGVATIMKKAASNPLGTLPAAVHSYLPAGLFGAECSR